MPTKHAHDHFDLIIHVDIKTSKNENFTIIRHKTIYFLDQEYMHVFFFIISGPYQIDSMFHGSGRVSFSEN